MGVGCSRLPRGPWRGSSLPYRYSLAVRTHNRQIRSHRPPVPARPLCPVASPSAQLNGHVAGSESGIRPCPSRTAWSQSGRSFGRLLPDPLSGNSPGQRLMERRRRALKHQIPHLVLCALLRVRQRGSSSRWGGLEPYLHRSTSWRATSEPLTTSRTLPNGWRSGPSVVSPSSRQDCLMGQTTEATSPKSQKVHGSARP